MIAMSSLVIGFILDLAFFGGAKLKMRCWNFCYRCPVPFLFLEYHGKRSPFQPCRYLHQVEIEAMFMPA